VTEGEPVEIVLSCTGTGTATSFAAPDPPPGATVEGGVLRWTPGLAQAGSWAIEVLADWLAGDAGTVRVEVADAWDAEGNVPVDPLVYQEEWGLPVLHLTRPPDTNDQSDVATTMVWRGETFDIDLKYRGASSLYYPKNSYTLSFPSDHEFEDEDTGFRKRRKIVLTSTFDDNSYVRQKLCFDVWTTLDPARAPMQAIFAVVHINGAYEGLYLLGDHVDGEYWEDAGFREDGNLYKSVDHSANFYGTYNGRPKSSLHSGYEKKEGTEGDWTDLDELVAYVIEATDETYADGLRERAALSEFMDWWILVAHALAEDSGGKNVYLYDDPKAPGWHVIPWDFNHSWGQAWESSRTSVGSVNDFRGANNLFHRMLGDAGLSAELRARYATALDGPLSVPTLTATLDAYYAEIDRSAARDWARWGDDYASYYGWRSDLTTFEEEKAYLYEWVEGRDAVMRGAGVP